MDEKDKKILKMLSEDARIPVVEIAKRIGISDVAVRKRIKKLEKKGIIEGYTIKTNFKTIGYIVSLTGFDVEKDAVLNIIEKLKTKKYVHAIYLTTGDHMVIASVWAKDSSQMAKYHKEMEKIHGVKKVCPAIILEKVK